MPPVRLEPRPWSWTRLNQAQRCSYAFFLGSANLIPSDKRAAKRKETQIGIGLHKVARFLLETEGEMTITLGDDWVIPISYYVSLQSFIMNELPKLKALVGPDAEVVPELQIRLDEDLNPEFGWPNGFIVGGLDLSIYSPTTKNCVIVDYKTGNTSDEDLVKYYRPQLELYSLLFHRGYAPIERIGLVIQAGKSHWLTDQLEPFNLDSALLHLQTHVDKALANLEVIQPQENGLCRYCSFRSLCPIYEDK